MVPGASSTLSARLGQALLAIPVGLAGGFLLGGFIAITEFLPHLSDASSLMTFGGVPGAFIGVVLFPLCYWILLIRIPVAEVVAPVGIATYVGAVIGILISAVTGLAAFIPIVLGGASGCVVASVVLWGRNCAGNNP
jgi:hypothetical protein